MNAPKILVFAGSAREGSLNKKLSKIAAEAARKAGAETTWIDLRDFPMPLYDGDLEERSGLPENASRLKDLMIGHHAFVIVSPEYNSSIPPLLKNAVDWVSRKDPKNPNEKSLAAFDGKIASLLSASPGALGGLRGLVTLRSILGNIGVIVLPDQFALGKAHEAFDEQGRIKDAGQQAAVEKIAASLVAVVKKLAV